MFIFVCKQNKTKNSKKQEQIRKRTKQKKRSRRPAFILGKTIYKVLAKVVPGF